MHACACMYCRHMQIIVQPQRVISLICEIFHWWISHYLDYYTILKLLTKTSVNYFTHNICGLTSPTNTVCPLCFYCVCVECVMHVCVCSFITQIMWLTQHIHCFMCSCLSVYVRVLDHPAHLTSRMARVVWHPIV